jgi:hypothetical protein
VVDRDRYENKNLGGDWDEDPEDVLAVLLVHSDCEGHIHHRHTKPLAERLETLLPRVDINYQPHTKQFIEGLRQAHALNQMVIFQ